MKDLNLKKFSQLSLSVIGIVVVVMILQRFDSLLRPLSIGILLTFLFTPLLRMSGKDKYKAIAKIIGSILVFIIVVGGVIYLSFTQIADLKNDKSLEDLNEGSYLERTVSIGGQEIIISEAIDVEQARESIRSVVRNIVGSFFTFISELFLVLIFLIFLIPLINKTINQSKTKDNVFYKFSEDIEKSINGYLKSKLLISLGTAATSYVILLLFGVKLAIAFALLMFLFNFIPTFGDYITFGIILVTQLFVMGPGLKLLGLFACLLAIQMIFGNYIEPRYAGKMLSLPPIVVILSLLFWGAVWGIGGMLFAVPLTLAVRTLFNYTKHISHKL